VNASEHPKSYQRGVKLSDGGVHKFTPDTALSELQTPTRSNLQKRVRFELTDEKGIKHIHVVEGPISRADLMKTMDALEMMDLAPTDSHPSIDSGTFFGKVQTLLETTFAAGDFSSSDVAREFEEKYSQPVKLSTISTYLSRLADRQYIKREKFGNSWVYRRVYLKPAQVAER
jgi:penicillinase repressor